jgi:hypothetical protein
MITWVKQLDRILRGQATRPSDLKDGQIDVSVRGLALILLLLAMLYGVCMGVYGLITHVGKAHANPPTSTVVQGVQQMLYSTVKVPMLFFLTLLITFPSLYVFNALVGSRLTIKSVLRLLVAAMGVLLAVLASFGTIVAFFSVSTKSYPFILLLNVLVFTIAGVMGLTFLLRTLHRLTLAQELAEWEEMKRQSLPTEPPPVTSEEFPPPEHTATPTTSLSALDRLPQREMGRNVKAVFRIWVIVFALVGAQMGWVLRPFIGSPNREVTFFRPRESNFFQAVWQSFQNLFSDGDKSSSR